MSRTPSGLAVIAMGQKIMKNKKCDTQNMVWPWLSSEKKKWKMSWTPYGLAVAIIGKKKEQGKMSRMPSGLALFANGPKF